MKKLVATLAAGLLVTTAAMAADQAGMYGMSGMEGKGAAKKHGKKKGKKKAAN